MTTPTKAEIKVVSDKIREAVRKVLEGTGYELTTANSRYSSTDLDMTLRMFKGDGKTKGAVDWEKYSGVYDLPTGAFGASLSMGGKNLLISGFNPKATKNKILLTEGRTGRSFHCAIAAMHRALTK